MLLMVWEQKTENMKKWKENEQHCCSKAKEINYNKYLHNLLKYQNFLKFISPFYIYLMQPFLRANWDYMDFRKQTEKNIFDFCSLLHTNQWKLCHKIWHKRKFWVFSRLIMLSYLSMGLPAKVSFLCYIIRNNDYKIGPFTHLPASSRWN